MAGGGDGGGGGGGGGGWLVVVMVVMVVSGCNAMQVLEQVQVVGGLAASCMLHAGVI